MLINLFGASYGQNLFWFGRGFLRIVRGLVHLYAPKIALGTHSSVAIDAIEIVAEGAGAGQILKSPLPAAQVDFSGCNPRVIVDGVRIPFSCVAGKRGNAAGVSLGLHLRRESEGAGNVRAG